VKILAICGSLQAKSANRSLIESAQRLAPSGITVSIFNGLGELPHFNPELDGPACPAAVLHWRQAIAASDALLIAAPEYGHSLPGVLKNAIDWLIGSGELEEKLIAFTASTPVSIRGRLGLRALRDALGAVRAQLVGGEPVVRGPSEEADIVALLRALERKASGVKSSAAPPRPVAQITALGPADATAYNAFLRAGTLAHADTLRIAAADIDAAPFSTSDTAETVTLVARSDAGDWLGVVTLEREAGREKRRHIAWIYRMYVESGQSGVGVGRQLLSAALLRARTMPGVAKVNLTVAAHNLRAVGLYASAGFREFAREEDAFRDPQSRAELSMALALEL